VGVLDLVDVSDLVGVGVPVRVRETVGAGVSLGVEVRERVAVADGVKVGFDELDLDAVTVHVAERVSVEAAVPVRVCDAVLEPVGVTVLVAVPDAVAKKSQRDGLLSLN